MIVPLDAITDFLTDEGLGPYKIKKNFPDNYTLTINEPPEWGTNDKRGRCGFFVKEIKGNKMTLFNAFKAAAHYGDDYHGDFFKFVKLVKNFDSIKKAKNYFVKKYLAHKNIECDFTSDQSHDENIPKVSESIDLPMHFEKFDVSNTEHKPYLEYLEIKRKIPLDIIQKTKLFVDKKDKRIIFPVYEDEQLIFYGGRDITGINPIPWLKSKGEERYPIWNLENIIGNVIIVFEAVADAIYFSHGVALFGVGSEEQLKKILKKNFSKIILVFDNDEPGRKAKVRWAEWLKSHGQNGVYIYNYYGINQKDFGKMSECGVPFDIGKRIIPWNFATETNLKMGKLT